MSFIVRFKNHLANVFTIIGQCFARKNYVDNSKVKVKESLDMLQKLKILIDYDDDGYLLQVGPSDYVGRGFECR